MNKEAPDSTGHLCFECYRQIDADDVRTVTYMGPLPVHHHTSCFFGEEKTQQLIESALAAGKRVINTDRTERPHE